jgi:pimeloyl-ACP methyl ester carboxylesterase
MLGPFQSGASAGGVATALAEGYGLQLLAPDAPAFGGSPPLPAERYRPSSVADLARDILDALDVGTVDWIGASWGGTVGCHFAERHRDRLRRLVLLDVGYQEPLEQLPLEEWIESRRPLGDAALGKLGRVCRQRRRGRRRAARHGGRCGRPARRALLRDASARPGPRDA